MIQLKRANFKKKCRTIDLHEYYKKIRFQLILCENNNPKNINPNFKIKDKNFTIYIDSQPLNIQKKYLNIQKRPFNIKNQHFNSQYKPFNQQNQLFKYQNDPLSYKNETINDQKQNFKLSTNEYEQQIDSYQLSIPSDSPILSKLTYLINQLQQGLLNQSNNQNETNKIIQKCIKALVHIDRYIQELNTNHFKRSKLKQELQQMYFIQQVSLINFKDVLIMFLLKNKQQKIDLQVSQVLVVWLLLYLPNLQRLTQDINDNICQFQQQNQNQDLILDQSHQLYSQSQTMFQSKKSLLQLDRLSTIQLMLEITQFIQIQNLVQILNGQYHPFSMKVMQIFEKQQLLKYGLQQFIIQNIQAKYAFLPNVYKTLSQKEQTKNQIIHNQTLQQTLKKLKIQFQKYDLQVLQNQIYELVLQQKLETSECI